MREAKGHFTFFSFSGEEKSWRRRGRVCWRRSSFLSETIAQKSRSTVRLIYYCTAALNVHRNRGVRLPLKLYGLHLFHSTEIEVFEVCTVCIKCCTDSINYSAQKSRYGLCTVCIFVAWNSRKSTACFAAVRPVLLALFSREMYGLLELYICIWFCTKKEEGCWLVCWALISRLWDKVCRWR